MRAFFFLALISLFALACGSDPAPADATGEETTETTAEKTAAPLTQGEISLTPMPASPDFPGAGITSMSYEGGKFSFGIKPGKDGYQLGLQTPGADDLMCANSAQGQHIHLIVDNEPYAAKYTSEFDYEIADGEHYILAFISRSYHESIKHKGAATAVVARVENNAILKQGVPTEPLLFYSRPKGTYVGKDTENLMLDFYLANMKLENGEYSVKVEIDDAAVFMINTWQPYFINGLKMGEHTITLTLVDRNGATVDSPMNPVSRTFTLAEDKGDS